MDNSQIWNNSLAGEVIQLNKKYFQFANHVDTLPTDLLREVLLFLPANSYGSLCCVCHDWYQVLVANELWRHLFIIKFVLTNKLHPLPALPSTMVAPSTPSLHSPRPKSGGVLSPNVFRGFIDLYRQRLNDPVIGDKVEVAWRGKFRLETQDVYQGLAWWCAEIVDKHRSKFKIHYPGWESRWDEWVPKTRLRWSVRANSIEQIYPGDIVELWCCGTNVPGAWLESRVREIRKGKYALEKVLATGYLWVERDRLRLVRRGELGQKKQEQQGKKASRRRRSSNAGGDNADGDQNVEEGNNGEGANHLLPWMATSLRDNRCNIC